MTSVSTHAQDATALADELEQCILIKRVPGLGDMFLDKSKVATIMSALRSTPSASAGPQAKPMKLELSDEWCLNAADREAQLQLAPGCRSAASPCSHQKSSPYTLCDACQPALKAVTIVIPTGYRDAAEFLKDCQFEEASAGPQAEAISFGYTNYRGENSFRHARPISIRYGTSEWHKREGWLLLALDLEKHEEREFAMRDMLMVEPANAITLYAHPQPQQADGRGAVIEGLPKPETMLTYASILEKPKYQVDEKTGIKYRLATGEVVEAACAALRYCAALQQSPATDGAFTQCEKCWQPATCKKYGCREPAVSRPDRESPTSAPGVSVPSQRLPE